MLSLNVQLGSIGFLELSIISPWSFRCIVALHIVTEFLSNSKSFGLRTEQFERHPGPSNLNQKLQGSSAYICWFLDSSPRFHRNPLFSHHLRSLTIVTSIDSEAFPCLYTFLGCFSSIWTTWPNNLPFTLRGFQITSIEPSAFNSLLWRPYRSIRLTSSCSFQ